ncbi:MAG: hypothetical protein K6A23_06555 [Butyrivibrio sp.]|nr:hypothetical protein [Butyrivibrio sp.]
MSLELENEEVEVKTPVKKKTKKTKELIEENGRQREALETEKVEHEKALEGLLKEMDDLGSPSAVGMKVSHKKFGDGKVVSQDGKYIEVEFSSVTKKFVLPGAIADKFLIVDDDKLLEHYSKANELHEKILKEQLKIQSDGFALQRLSDQLEKLNEKA